MLGLARQVSDKVQPLSDVAQYASDEVQFLSDEVREPSNYLHSFENDNIIRVVNQISSYIQALIKTI